MPEPEILSSNQTLTALTRRPVPESESRALLVFREVQALACPLSEYKLRSMKVGTLPHQPL